MIRRRVRLMEERATIRRMIEADVWQHPRKRSLHRLCAGLCKLCIDSGIFSPDTILTHGIPSHASISGIGRCEEQ